MLNPNSDGLRFLPPLESRRAAKNSIFLKALGNYALQQAAKAEDDARARERAIELDEDNEQCLFLPPEGYEDLLAECINFDALVDDLAKRQAQAYASCDLYDDDYY